MDFSLRIKYPLLVHPEDMSLPSNASVPAWSDLLRCRYWSFLHVPFKDPPTIQQYQEPITRSLQLPHLPSLPYTRHGAFTDRSIFSLNLCPIQIPTGTSVTNCNHKHGLMSKCGDDVDMFTWGRIVLSLSICIIYLHVSKFMGVNKLLLLLLF